MLNDASVVHPRRADLSQVPSSVLNILYSSGTGPLSIQTPAHEDLIQGLVCGKKSAHKPGGVKKTASARGPNLELGTKSIRAVSLVLCGRSRLGVCRLWNRLHRRAPRCRRWHAGLRIVGLNDRLR